jgi:uncharacterized protein (UPF0333 family)
MCKKGQISIEYLIVIGFVVFLVLGILGIAFFYSSGTNDKIRIDQITHYANKIISSSETVFYSGEPSKLTLTAYLPAGVNNVNVTGSEIIFTVSTGSGTARISFSSNVPLQGSLSNTEGVKRIEVLADQNGAQITET